MELITPDDVRKLLELFSASSFKPKDGDKAADVVQYKCVQLFKKDYPLLALINNENGELSTSYPSKLIVPQVAQDFSGCITSSHRSRVETKSCLEANKENIGLARETEAGETHVGNCFGTNIDAGKLRDLMARARVARCRARFPVPVILFEGKYICRSATISGGPEIYGRSGLDLLFPPSNEEEDTSSSTTAAASSSASSASAATYEDATLNNSTSCSGTSSSSVHHHHHQTTSTQQALPSLSSLSLGDSSQVFSKVRNQDINLLKYLSVKYICDLMVEKKKVKYGVNITSSEKADKEGRYADFEILSLPYPGCEFFRAYRDNRYAAEGLVFDWNQHFVDATLDIPRDRMNCDFMEINWTGYKSWDIIKLTTNYLKLLLHCASESSSSMLVHCISGWDRTPLFISLLRLSLWADGKVHQNLSPLEITYLTVAYDWYLFGHNLNDRISKGEEILFFCFYFLKFMISEEFSVDRLRNLAVQSKRKSQNETPRSFEFNMDDCVMSDNTSSSSGSSRDKTKGNGNFTSTGYLGSCTSLNSTSSIGSVRSQDTGPPLYFPVAVDDNATSFCCVRDIDVVDGEPNYPRTPPTLTNSEEGGAFLDSHDENDSSIETLIAFGSMNGSTNRESKVNESAYIDFELELQESKKSTPMEIPPSRNGSSSTNGRRRCDSTLNDGWQMVTETGSVRETTSSSSRGFYSSPDSNDSISSSNRSFSLTAAGQSDGPNAAASCTPTQNQSRTTTATITTNNTPSSSAAASSTAPSTTPQLNSQKALRHTRKEKLQAVRSIFYNAYSAAIGYRFKNGQAAAAPSAGPLGHIYQQLGIGAFQRITAPQMN